MKKNYCNFKFDSDGLIPGEEYEGQIVRKRIQENIGGDDKLLIWVKLYQVKGMEFLYACRISKSRNSRFYRLCNDLYLFNDDGTVNLEEIQIGDEVRCTFSEMEDGNFLISTMEWIGELEEEKDE